MRAAEMVPFVIPARFPADSPIAYPWKAIPKDDERVAARDGHFYRGKERMRIWGVNLCFGANFPKHEDAEQVALRMAAMGVNSVRFHHMDNAAFPRGIWDPKDAKKLSEEALERLDYFIDQLAKHGIYANLNLHVSRAQSKVLGLPDSGDNYNKMVDIFTPDMVAAQRQYARDLLGHVNKYRGVRYADDPAVAFVEINNEDSLFMWGADQKLRALPEYYAKVLQGLYGEWVKKRYGVTAKLREAWAKGVVPLGADALADAKFDGVLKGLKADERGWRLFGHADCAAKGVGARDAAGGVRAEIAKTDGVAWHVQLLQNRVAVKAGQYYTVSFRARADAARTASVGLQQAHEPWKSLGLYRVLNLAAEWRDVSVSFVAGEAEDNAQLVFNLGESATAVEVAAVQFRPGGLAGLGEKESLEAGNVAVFADNEGPERTLDRMRFLAETEKLYFDGMREFIKKDMGCKALVTGTIVFGPLGLWAQSDMDYVDSHAYWQHPRFPRRPWDPADWTVEQVAMVDKPAESTLVRISAERLAGKPFTVSEYNHPAPNDYQAECVPMVSAWAAAQDWDGVWLFAYSHRTDDWARESFTSFFDIDANPAKWGFMRVGAAILRDGGVAPLTEEVFVPIANKDEALDSLARLHLKRDRDMWSVAADLGKVKWSDLCEKRLYLALSDKWRRGEYSVARTSLGWREAGGWFHAEGPGAEIHVARREHLAGAPLFGGPDDRKVEPAFFVIAVATLDGKSFRDSRKALVTACGRCENTGMKFSADRRTVGRDWGGPLVCIEPVSTPYTLSWVRPGWTCRALGPDGRPTKVVEVSGNFEGMVPFVTLNLDPGAATMWYLLERKGDGAK